ncbi:MAG: hypothetical protein LBE09_05525 [Christensenellaceae bacterium]|jgi:hypothetical protein|nr:hypothetical protein [Christensenellaceae bacterium]
MFKKSLAIVVVLLFVSVVLMTMLLGCEDTTQNTTQEEAYVPSFISAKAKNVLATVKNYAQIGFLTTPAPLPSDIVVEDFFTIKDRALNNTHIQGLARYKDYAIVGINGDTEKYESKASVGLLLAIHDTNGLVYNTTTPKHPNNTNEIEYDVGHISGMQVIGDYLFLVAHCHSYSKWGSTQMLIVYDLSPLLTENRMELYNVSLVPNVNNTMCITTVVKDGEEVLAWGNPDGSMLVSKIPKSREEGFEWIEYKVSADSHERIHDAQSAALVTDDNNEIWLFRFVNLEGGGYPRPLYEDHLYLGKIEFVGDEIKYTLELNRMFTQGDLSTPDAEVYPAVGLVGLHTAFRFAATIQVQPNGEVWTYSSQSVPSTILLKAAKFAPDDYPQNYYMNVYKPAPSEESA